MNSDQHNAFLVQNGARSKLDLPALIWSWPLVHSAQIQADNFFDRRRFTFEDPVECIASYTGVRLRQPLTETSRLWTEGHLDVRDERGGSHCDEPSGRVRMLCPTISRVGLASTRQGDRTYVVAHYL
ncbi:uncharacterized protein MYCGRDRAFT_95290 [Zymoseptoria tritici IPO323]|uniref:Uncharacterized protein n=1 Tax=Zymoseptoria tritici (strain CBS 115943 / IPO323) TaxID=336722 RepID=F9XII4_ZYMTI|nr:uncharacterized protein MYCGRDRAFT_95290 [Zymoseptoria tritici IPO323]EGP85284.1 hypothetical protein MYCGRDRAFT_95290 [Zymoseptoria tritici IPO323]